MEPYFNSTYGAGLEGFFNYSNTLVDGWFANAILIFVWIVVTYVMNKGEAKLASSVTLAFFLSFITAIILKLIMEVSEFAILVTAIGLGVSLVWLLIADKN